MSSSALKASCASVSEDGTLLAVGFTRGFGIFTCYPFAERFRRTFSYSEEVRVPPDFNASNSALSSAQMGRSVAQPFAFQAIQHLDSTNLIALVGNGEPSCAPATALHFTEVFQKHKVILWDMEADAIFRDIGIGAYVSSALCRGITGLVFRRDRVVFPAASCDEREPPASRGDERESTMSLSRLIECSSAGAPASREVPPHEGQFRLRLLIVTDRTGSFVFCIEGELREEGRCRHSMYQAAHYKTAPNGGGVGVMQLVDFVGRPQRPQRPGRASPGLLVALSASSVGCIRAVYAVAEPIAPAPASVFIEAHSAQRNALGCLALSDDLATLGGVSAAAAGVGGRGRGATDTQQDQRPCATFLLASTSAKAHSVHLYHVTAVPDTSAPPALLSVTKVKELRRAYTNSELLGSIGLQSTDTVCCMAFSPRADFLAVASTLGAILIFALHVSEKAGGSGGTSGDGAARAELARPEQQQQQQQQQGDLGWGSWLLTSAASLVSATVRAVDHEAPALSLFHPVLAAKPAEPGHGMRLSFSGVPGGQLLLHAVTAAGTFATFKIAESSGELAGALIAGPLHLE